MADTKEITPKLTAIETRILSIGRELIEITSGPAAAGSVADATAFAAVGGFALARLECLATPTSDEAPAASASA